MAIRVQALGAVGLRGGAGVLERHRGCGGGERERLFGRRPAENVAASVPDELESELLESYREGGRALDGHAWMLDGHGLG